MKKMIIKIVSRLGILFYIALLSLGTVYFGNQLELVEANENTIMIIYISLIIIIGRIAYIFVAYLDKKRLKKSSKEN